MMRFWLNLIGFQTVWMVSVGGAANGYWWAGPLALLVFAGWQLSVGPDRRADGLLLVTCALLGFAVDSLWVQLGWMQFASPLPWGNFAPIWIVAMWVGFALTLNHSMARLRQWPLAAAALGLVGGPLAYWTAAGAFDAVSFGAPVAWVLAALALGWAAVLPLLFAIDNHLAAGAAIKRAAA